ncbi:MAG: hypothetical protein ACXABK_06535, partial [Candidatus Heimdallarchaeaceae archaeon]
MTDSDLELSTSYGTVVFKNESSMGHGTSCWFNDRKELTYDSEDNFNLHEGINYVGFAAVGFEAYSLSLDNFRPKPSVDFSSRIFTIDTSNTRATFKIAVPIMSFLALSIAMR